MMGQHTVHNMKYNISQGEATLYCFCFKALANFVQQAMHAHVSYSTET